MERFNILFICKHNVFRSQVAEAYFNQINKNPKIKATSGGLFPGHPLNPEEVKAAKKLGVKMKGPSKGVSYYDLKKQDLIIIVADDVPKNIVSKRVYSRWLRHWNIRDTDKAINYRGAEEIVRSIKSKVEELYMELSKKLMTKNGLD